ncbi:hypothetical protein BGZ68_002786 [Mortierella alpina]|nr:hypothetical protein BGZ68_002786 [Mortierella alpina]
MFLLRAVIDNTQLPTDATTNTEIAMASALSPKEQQKSLKATIKTIEQDYKNKLRDAEKKCNDIRKEAEKVAERERAETKARKEKADKAAKDEYQMVKTEISEIHIRLVMDLVKNAILDVKARHLNDHHPHLQPQLPQQQKQQQQTRGSLDRSSSCWSSSSSRGCSSSSSAALSTEEAEVKEWIDYAADRLEMHMSKSQVRHRLLEEITTAALERQHQAQKEAERRTEDLQRQIEQLQLLQRQQQLQQPREGAESISAPGMDVPPPAYVNAVGPAGIGESDYSVYSDKKR